MMIRFRNHTRKIREGSRPFQPRETFPSAPVDIK